MLTDQILTNVINVLSDVFVAISVAVVPCGAVDVCYLDY